MSRALALVVPVVLAYAGSLVWIWQRWWQAGSYYSHGPLVWLLAAFLLASRWPRPDATSLPPGELRGWWLLGPGLLLHLCGAALTIDSVSASSLWLSVPGLAMLVAGRARLRGLWPVLLLILLAVPPPIFVTGRIAFELKEVAIDAGLGLCHLLGLDAQRFGAQISIPGQTETLRVAPACSGLRSLVALVTLGYCVAFFFGPQRGPRRWLVLASAFPIAILANVLRIAAICLLAAGSSVVFASTTGHTLLNVAEWVFDLGFLLGVDLLASRSRGGDP